MGVVWAAVHTITRRPVALKFLKDRGLDSSVRRRFVREARAACAVGHEGVVPVHDVVESDTGEPALVMDLLSGEALASRLRRDAPLALDEAARILLAIASAVSAAHAAGIIHRDLKPENVFLTEAGEVKILDFGVAKVTSLDAETARSIGTETSAIVGTPSFMAPEQAFDDQDIDHRADIWSLGLVAYECLSGVLPTRSASIGQILKIILTGAIRPLAEVAPDVPADVSLVVDRMLRRERDERPSLAEVCDVLARAAALEAPRLSAPATRFSRAPTTPRSSDRAASSARAETALADTVLAASRSRRGSEARGASRDAVFLGGGAAILGVGIAVAILARGGGERTTDLRAAPAKREVETAASSERSANAPSASAPSASASLEPSASAPSTPSLPSSSLPKHAKIAPRTLASGAPQDDARPKAGELDF